MNKGILFIAVVLFLSGACQKTGTPEAPQEKEPKSFAAITEDSGTRTVLSWINIHWTKGDKVSIFAGKTVNDKYQVTDESDGQSRADLYLVSNGDNTDSELAANIAYYPYLPSFSGVRTTETGYEIESILPDKQTYSKDSFGNGAFPMAAVTSTPEDCNLQFKNILGGVKLQLKGTAKIKRITIKGNKDEILCGPVKVALSATELPKILEFTQASFADFVQLDCGDGVQLNTETATSFIIALPPMTLPEGFSISICDTEDNEMRVSTSKSQTIARSGILKMPEITFDTTVPVNLSQDGTANCYVVSSEGKYQFKPTKGNSQELLENVESAVVLWQSFGTDVAPHPGELVETAYYKDGMIFFTAKEKKGNAVIAAQDKDGEILWSWHICLTDKPQGQVYNNNAGTMMDRNLGATSATPGDVGALGLLYQWGRKDPFLGGCQISYEKSMMQTKAASSIVWPSAKASDSSNGTIAFSVSHPTTFVSENASNRDWCYSGSNEIDKTRWQSSKTIYDPCPSGWRVPEGGADGVWVKAFNTSEDTQDDANWDSDKMGMDFSTTKMQLGTSGPIWYPAAGSLNASSEPEVTWQLFNVGVQADYWTCTPTPLVFSKFYECYVFRFDKKGFVRLKDYDVLAAGHQVRCLKEE